MTDALCSFFFAVLWVWKMNAASSRAWALATLCAPRVLRLTELRGLLCAWGAPGGAGRASAARCGAPAPRAYSEQRVLRTPISQLTCEVYDADLKGRCIELITPVISHIA